MHCAGQVLRISVDRALLAAAMAHIFRYVYCYSYCGILMASKTLGTIHIQIIFRVAVNGKLQRKTLQG